MADRVALDDAAQWRDVPVLITGHTGFIGSWLALSLYRLGALVSGYALDPPSTPSHFDAAQISQLLVDDVRADIRDASALRDVLDRSRPAVIFHLAAQPLVLASVDRPRDTFDVNIMGMVDLCEVIRASSTGCTVVAMTSDKCYRNDQSGIAFTEDDPLGGDDPYSASKAGTELVAAAYRASYFPPGRLDEHGVTLATVRAGNVIGGGDWAEHRLVPDMVRALAAGSTPIIRNPRSTRPWQHVLEPVSGLLAVATHMHSRAESGSLAPVWNLGPTRSHRVDELADAVLASWGEGRWDAALDVPAAPTEAAALNISIDKAHRELGWAPRWDLAQTVRQTIEWYRSFYKGNGSSMRDDSLDAIAAFEKAATDT